MEQILENIHEHLHLLKDEELRRIANEMPLGDLLDMWRFLSEEEAVRVFLLLSLERKVNLITSLGSNEQEWLIKSLSLENARVLFEEMEPDDVVDILQEVSPSVREAVWNSLSDSAKQLTKFLLRFDEDDAAGIMTPRYLAIRQTITIGEAIAFIRKNGADVETVYYVYVVDQFKRLIGVVSLKDLLFVDDTVRIEDMMTRNFVFVREETDQEEAAKTLEAHDHIALPVLDRYNRLLGIITFDDVFDVIREEQTEDVYKMGAMEGRIDPYLGSSVFSLVKRRIPWLIILLIAGTITTNLINLYEPLLLGAAFLIWFVPVITQTGGNSGTQSSTLMIRGIATGEIVFRDLGRILLKEFVVGLLLGIGLALVIFLRGVFLPPGIEWFQALAIAAALAFVVLFSSVIGAFAPLIIYRAGLDPTVMAGPLMATVIDVAGLTIYFEVASLILNL
jgi:magnesium transporter